MAEVTVNLLPVTIVTRFILILQIQKEIRILYTISITSIEHCHPLERTFKWIRGKNREMKEKEIRSTPPYSLLILVLSTPQESRLILASGCGVGT